MRHFLWTIPALLILSGAAFLPTTAPTASTAPGTTSGTTSVAPVAVRSVSLVAVGDIACPPGQAATRKTCRQAATARIAKAQKPRRVIALGDLQYPKGTFRDFRKSYAKSWGALKSITYPIAGNHEYQTPGARGYYRYFRYRQPGAPGYYRRAINGWQLYLLNSNCTKIDCAAQLTWLRRQLARHPSRCALIATHHPRFSSGAEHGSNESMKPFWDLAYQARVDVALSGHDHHYERFAPMTPEGVVARNGIRQFVSGAGGKSHYASGTVAAGSRKFLASPFGVLKLTLRPTNYSWKFIGIRGKVLDSGTSVCR